MWAANWHVVIGSPGMQKESSTWSSSVAERRIRESEPRDFEPRFTITDAGRRALRMAELFETDQ
jgi:hypothetical protein